ncbi:MAG: methyltransferase family protein [Calditrichia bacterium]
MNILNWLKTTGNLGNLFFKIRGFTPYPIVLLFILFAHPTFHSFLAGFFLMALGESIRIWSVAYAGNDTRSREIGAIRLITSGPYARVRNPLYLANMFIYTGATIIANVWPPYFLMFVWIYFGLQYYLIIKLEENTLSELFGETYLNFKQAVPRYLPRLSPVNIHNPVQTDFKSALVSEKSTFLSLTAVLIILYLKMAF